MRTITILFSILVACLLTSCYTEIDIEKYRTTPKIVINCAISPDTVIMASITRTWFFTDQNKLTPSSPWGHTEETPNVNLRNAKVELFIDDVYKEDLKWEALAPAYEGATPDTFFVSTITPDAGNKIKIVATTTEYGTAWAEDVVPAKVPIESIQTTCRTEIGPSYWPSNSMNTKNEYYAFYYNITFQDTPGKADYYLLLIDDGDADYSDPVFQSSGSTLDGALGFDGIDGRGGRVFTDQFIDGQKYTIQVKELVTPESFDSKYTEDGIKERTISLYALSEPYYQYLLSLEKISASTLNNALGNAGMAEPLRVYTNVENGIGILGACQRTDVTMKLNDYLPAK